MCRRSLPTNQLLPWHQRAVLYRGHFQRFKQIFIDNYYRMVDVSRSRLDDRIVNCEQNKSSDLASHRRQCMYSQFNIRSSRSSMHFMNCQKTLCKLITNISAALAGHRNSKSFTIKMILQAFRKKTFISDNNPVQWVLWFVLQLTGNWD